MFVLLLICFLNIFLINAYYSPCSLRKTPNGSVCVCNSTYCDTVPKIAHLRCGEYQLYTTSQAKLGFYSTTGKFSNNSADAPITLRVANLSNTHQTIYGFGGAFTDATGINILTLPRAARKLLMESYFGEDGLQYSLCRVPIGGTDFSTRAYTYDDEKNDTPLKRFALQKEDYKYKIPFIKQAKYLRGNEPFRLYASAWTAPPWMKTSDSYVGSGLIQEKYLQLWAKYYIKFFDAYQQNGISFWGVTTQNEPVNGLIDSQIPNNGFTSDQMVRWVALHLGPTIRNSSYRDIKIILHDDQRVLLPILKVFVLSDEEVIKYSDGIGLHWYTDKVTPPFYLTFAKSDTKYLFRLATEACEGFLAAFGSEEPVVLGSWGRAESYLESIFIDLEYDFVGWVDWNMALDLIGGPNYVNNFVDSPIIVNKTSGEFYKQPMFYVQGHFSKFVVPDSIRLDLDLSGKGIKALAFKRPDNKIVLIMENSSNDVLTVKINILGSTEIFTIDDHSINTLLYYA